MINTEQKSYTRSKRLLRNHDTLVMWIQGAINIGIVVLTLAALAFYFEGYISAKNRYLGMISVLLMVIVYRKMGVHRRFGDNVSGIKRLIRAWGVVVILLAAVTYISGDYSSKYSHTLILYWIVLAVFAQALCYPLVHYLQKLYHLRAKRQQVLSAVIGSGEVASHLMDSINRNSWLPDNIIGKIAIDSDEGGASDNGRRGLWHYENLVDIIKDYDIRRIYIAVPLDRSGLVEDIQQKLFPYNIDIIWAPDISALHLLNPSVREVAGIPLVSLSENPLMAGGAAFIKGVMDRVLAFCMIIALSPVLIGTAVAVKVSSPGPVIFKQRRNGWDGRVIVIYKFRSMVVHENKDGHVQQAQVHDPRITKVGAFIRRTSIDELPQLLNVLQGGMSLVGPRPHAVEHNEFYSSKVAAYLARHRIKPGITGLAQIHGYRGEIDDMDKMKMRIHYDLEYINNWSLWRDLVILIKTPLSLFSSNAR